jgi:thiosulfate sulfurtransferase
MDAFKEIPVEEAGRMLQEGRALFLDVRDPASYEAAHVPGALYLSDGNISEFVDKTDKSRPLVVYCYHGYTSQGAAAYLLDQGFREVYSVIGGFERWRQSEEFES